MFSVSKKFGNSTGTNICPCARHELQLWLSGLLSKLFYITIWLTNVVLSAVLVPPNQPNVTRLSDVSVMVRWSVPENKGLPIQFFKVQYRELGQKMNGKQSKWMTANMEIPNHVRSFEVTDLQPDHTYRFRIAAVYSNNDNELSQNSVRFHLNRVAGFDSNKMPIPLLTNTEALGPDRVLLIWQNPDRSANIDGFYVYHRASTSAGEYIKTTVEGKNSTNITISHLLPDTTYEFKVQSFSVDAASEFSKIIREKTQKAMTEAPPVQQVLPENAPKNADNGRNGNMYAIIGGALGGATLLAALGVIGVVYKRSKIKQSRETSQNEGNFSEFLPFSFSLAYLGKLCFSMYLKFWTFIRIKLTKDWLELHWKNRNFKKVLKKLHFLSKKLIFHCLKKNSSKKRSFFLLSFTWTFRTSGTLFFGVRVKISKSKILEWLIFRIWKLTNVQM